MKVKRAGVTLGILFALSTTSAAQQSSPLVQRIHQRSFVRPVDELKNDRSFSAFRRRLEAAIARRDFEVVYKAVAPAFSLYRDCCPELRRGQTPLAIFKRQFEDEHTRREIDLALRLGVVNRKSVGDGVFCGPAFHDAIPPPRQLPSRFSGSYHVAAPSVPLRARPDSSAREVGLLSWDIVWLPKVGQPPGGLWTKVLRLDGVSGYMRDRFLLRGLVGSKPYPEPDVCFAKDHAVWQIQTIDLGGD